MDDAFVIAQSWSRLSPDIKRLPLVEQAGYALMHSGVSITVTSATDVVAFGIGATTVSCPCFSFSNFSSSQDIASPNFPFLGSSSVERFLHLCGHWDNCGVHQSGHFLHGVRGSGREAESVTQERLLLLLLSWREIPVEQMQQQRSAAEIL